MLARQIKTASNYSDLIALEPISTSYAVFGRSYFNTEHAALVAQQPVFEEDMGLQAETRRHINYCQVLVELVELARGSPKQRIILRWRLRKAKRKERRRRKRRKRRPKINRQPCRRSNPHVHKKKRAQSYCAFRSRVNLNPSRYPELKRFTPTYAILHCVQLHSATSKRFVMSLSQIQKTIMCAS